MKIILIVFSILIILLYSLPLIRAKINIGNIFGIMTGILLLLFGIFFDNIKTLCETKSNRVLFFAFGVLAIIFYTAFFITLLKIIICEKSAKPKGKTVTVLGCRVKGTVPTRALMSRCKAAFDYLTENKNSVAVLSGGQGPDEDISEAECMYRILTEKGIDKTRLYIENASTSTEENLKFSSDVIDKNNLSKEIVICTSEYHIYRALMIAKKAGINATGLPAHSMRIFRIPAFTREVFGVWYLILKNLT